MGEITIGKALDDYKTVHMAYRNFAERTREEYLNDIGDFVEFLGKTGVNHVKAIGLLNIERYAARLEQDGYASRTRKRRIVAIRSFLSFLFQGGYIDQNIAKKVVVPFVENSTPYVLTQSECNRLREACAGNLRDRAIIELFFQTGIKLSELTHLVLDDIELGDTLNGYMRVKGEMRKKERVIPLNNKATSALRDYLDVRQLERNNILFLNRFGEALGNRGVQKILKKYLKQAEIWEATAQTLRHTFGAQHEAKGTDPKTVQDVMGLKDARSAAVYQTLAREVASRELQENAL